MIWSFSLKIEISLDVHLKMSLSLLREKYAIYIILIFRLESMDFFYKFSISIQFNILTSW